MDLTRTELLEVALDVLEADRGALPAGMDGRVVEAALARRRPALHVGWATPPSESSPHAAFITTVAELGQLLGALAPADWARQTQVDGGASVRDLVLHLVGVERYVLGQLGRRVPIDAPRAEDHFPVLRRAAADLGRARTTPRSPGRGGSR